jgi:hypothetical protein
MQVAIVAVWLSQLSLELYFACVVVQPTNLSNAAPPLATTGNTQDQERVYNAGHAAA